MGVTGRRTKEAQNREMRKTQYNLSVFVLSFCFVCFFSFSGAHRQVLLATIGWFIGYHITKYENYMYAKLDRDMNEYIKLHPEEFAVKGK